MRTTRQASGAHYLPAGSAATGTYRVQVTPESAGWTFSSLRVIALDRDEDHAFDTGGDEVAVLPLTGSVRVEAATDAVELAGRPSVFSGPTDLAHLGPGQTVRLISGSGGRFALCAARSSTPHPLHRLDHSEIPIELRGAGPASRLVRNFGVPGTLDAASLIACEVITPAGNWSSYPAHKHDEASPSESALEEIYYIEIAAGPNGEPGSGFMRVSSSPNHPIDIVEEVRDGDVVLVPHGWHGPCVAWPGHDMYYLNVMAGPPNPHTGEVRAWRITDHPDQAWVRASWATQPIDPRLLTTQEDADD